MKDILIVEDSQLERQRLERMLTEAGYRVQACASVLEAEQAVQQGIFRLAILDVGLGDRSGSVFFAQLRAAKEPPAILIFTGNPSMHLKQKFISEGATDYIIKGSTQAQNANMLARVREVIGEAQRQQARGMPLKQFLEEYVDEKSRLLFLDEQNEIPACPGCGGRSYVIDFSGQRQMPPEVKGAVLCSICLRPLDFEIR